MILRIVVLKMVFESFLLNSINSTFKLDPQIACQGFEVALAAFLHCGF